MAASGSDSVEESASASPIVTDESVLEEASFLDRNFKDHEEEFEVAERAAVAEVQSEAYREAMGKLNHFLGRAEMYNTGMNRKSAADRARFVRELDAPPLLSGGTLRDYQLAGFRWLSERFWWGEGCVLVSGKWHRACHVSRR
jgi:hypothetical protein